METAVFLIGSVYGGPCADCRLRPEPTAEVVLVLMPGETQSDLRCFPDEEIVDTQDIRSQKINQRGC